MLTICPHCGANMAKGRLCCEKCAALFFGSARTPPPAPAPAQPEGPPRKTLARRLLPIAVTLTVLLLFIQALLFAERTDDYALRWLMIRLVGWCAVIFVYYLHRFLTGGDAF